MKKLSHSNRVVIVAFAAFAAAVMARAETYTWVGGTGNWEDGAMWNSSQGEGGHVPGAGDHAVLPAPVNMADNYVVTANEAIDVGSLTVGSDTVEDDCLVTFESKTNGVHQVGAGGIVVKSGGKLTHTALPADANTVAAERYKLNFDVGGDVTVMSNGTIDVSGRGYASGKGPGYYKSHAAHGGTRFIGHTYGSLSSPTNCGTGTGTAGGGAVRIASTGTIRIDGSIVSGSKQSGGYNSGAGGSVWLTCSKLSGKGLVSTSSGVTTYGNSGCGGRISVCQTSAADFSEWKGRMASMGGGGGTWSYGIGAAGTIYLQSVDGPLKSTTIVDNGGQTTSTLDPVEGTFVELSAANASDVLGSLVVTNNGGVRISSGETIKVHGSINTTGGFSTWTAGTLQLSGLDPATISGGNKFGDFVCTEPGKTILFGTTADDNFEISSGHTLTLKGVKGTALDLRPVDETLQWKMKVNPDVETEIFYASVSNSNAKAGEYVTGYGSDDLGGNEKWIFTEVIEPGAIITWTGATDGDWTNPANWEPRRAVVKTDVAVVPSSAATMPVLDKGKVIINEIRVESGATLTLKGYDLTVTNKLIVAGSLTALGKENIFCPKDVDFTGGTFVAGGSSLVLEGNAAQQVNLNEQAFSTITIEKETGSVTFGDGFKAALLDVHSADNLTLTFAAGKTVEPAQLILRGERSGGGQALVLQSSSDGTPWKLKSGAAQFIAGVDVKDSDASAGKKALTDGSSVDSHGNSNWGFGVDGIVNAQWIGTSGGFATAENWSTDEVPDENTRVFIRAGNGETKSVTASEPIFVHDLILQGEGTGIATFESKTNATHRISGDLAVNIGGKMTHTALPANANTPADECYKLNLEVGGNVTVMADGTIDVTSRGYASGKGPGYYNDMAMHGGTRFAGHTYGSLSSPTNCGTGCGTVGGGVVRIASVGAIRIDGDIISGANKSSGYTSGSGGSVWLTCSQLVGRGSVSVNGGVTAYGRSGSGGRISVCQTVAADFSAWKGKMASTGGGGGVWSYGIGAAGTVYLQSSDGPLKSTTIVDNDGLSLSTLDPVEGSFVELNAANGSDVLGSLVVTNNGGVRISSGETVKICGDIDTTGGYPIWTSGTLQLAGLDPATISGGNQFGDFVCTEPGKTILFGTAAKDNFEMVSGHKLTLRGDEETTLDLRSANDPLQWKMKVNLDVATEIFYVSVSNSNAKAGEFVTAYGSEDLGGNTNWVFTGVIEPGAIITWTGAADSDWTNPLNWDLGRKVVETDVAVIPSVIDEVPVTTMPVLDKGKILINEVRIESGATVTLKGYDLTVTNKLTVTGTLTSLGKENIFCPKDVDFTGGTFVAGGSSLVFSGSGAQQVNLGGQTFSTITIEKDTGGIAFADGFKAAFLDAHGTDAMTLVFAAGKTVDATRLVLRGERKGGVPTLLLRSSEDGTPWKLKSGTAQFITGVDVKDSDASVGAWALTDFTSIDSHNNTHWDFGAGGVTNAQWIGTSGSFATAANWSTGEVPDENTRVFIRAGDGEERFVTASAAISVHDLILQGEGTGVATFESATKETHRISGDLAVNFGGKMTHTQSNDESKKLNLEVGGNVMVAADGTINVTSRGYANGKGPGYAEGKAASHGGCHAGGAPTYGSLSAPTNCGSGYVTAGGGVVRIVANGTITVDGIIISSANFGNGSYGSGSGGSVWLTGADLQGGGMISVQGGDDSWGTAGSGGRLAVWLTAAKDFGRWDGDFIAKGGAYQGASWGLGSAAPGTIYLQAAKGTVDTATVIIDNCDMGHYGDVGYAEIRAAAGWKDVGKVVVQNNALVKLVQYLRIGDLDMATKNAKINVGTNVLTIRYPVHKDGKGWADELDNLVVKEPDPDTGKTGDVVWKPQGFAIIVR